MSRILSTGGGGVCGRGDVRGGGRGACMVGVYMAGGMHGRGACIAA